MRYSRTNRASLASKRLQRFVRDLSFRSKGGVVCACALVFLAAVVVVVGLHSPRIDVEAQKLHANAPTQPAVTKHARVAGARSSSPLLSLKLKSTEASNSEQAQQDDTPAQTQTQSQPQAQTKPQDALIEIPAESSLPTQTQTEAAVDNDVGAPVDTTPNEADAAASPSSPVQANSAVAEQEQQSDPAQIQPEQAQQSAPAEQQQQPEEQQSEPEPEQHEQQQQEEQQQQPETEQPSQPVSVPVSVSSPSSSNSNSALARLRLGVQPPLRFIVFGDWGISTDGKFRTASGMGQQMQVWKQEDESLRAQINTDTASFYANSTDPPFVLSVGDQFYPDGVNENDEWRFISEWEQVYPASDFDCKVAFVLCLLLCCLLFVVVWFVCGLCVSLLIRWL